MNSQKNVEIVDTEDLENVELHRAESVVNQQIEILDQLKYDKQEDKGEDENNSVIYYVGNQARSIMSRFPPITAEVAMFLFMFSYVMRSITSTSMIMDKVCLVHLGYSEDTCHNLKDHQVIKDEVQKMANSYHLGHNLLQLLPSALLALFIGSWSDKYGRKFPIMIAQIGIIIDGFGTVICAYYFYSRVEYYFIPAIFTGLSGGFVGVLMTLYSYVSDVSNSGKRTLKYAFMELAFGLSSPLGSLAGGWIFKFYSFVPVFITSTCGHILSLVCVIFFLEETRGLDNKADWITKFRNFWSFKALITSFRTTAKKRPNRGREQIWYLILSMSIAVFNFASLAGIAFFYVHQQFNWENTTYSTVSAVYSGIGLTLMMIIVPIFKMRNIGDPVLGIIGSVSLMLKSICTGVAFKPWIYHLANLLGLLTGLGNLAGRSRLSKIIPKDDLGKVFAFLATAETLFPIAATAIISQAYNATLNFFPGLMYIVMGILITIPIGVYIWISRLPVVSYEEMKEGEPQEETKIGGTDNVESAKF